MNGEFKQWSEDALEIMKEADRSNKEEHRQIIDTVDRLCTKLSKSFRKLGMLSLSFFSVIALLVMWEVYENTPYFK